MADQRDTISCTVALSPNAQLEDDGRIELRAEVRDRTYLPTSDAEVEANIIRPGRVG